MSFAVPARAQPFAWGIRLTGFAPSQRTSWIGQLVSARANQVCVCRTSGRRT